MDRGAAVYALYIDMYRRWQTLQKTFSGQPQPHFKSHPYLWHGVVQPPSEPRCVCSSTPHTHPCLRLLSLRQQELLFFFPRTVAFFTFKNQNLVFRLTERLVVGTLLLKRQYYLLRYRWGFFLLMNITQSHCFFPRTFKQAVHTGESRDLWKPSSSSPWLK